MKVLCIEDALQEAGPLVRLMEEDMGCEVFLERSVEAARTVFEHEPEIALIVCDINSSCDHSIELLRGLREEPCWRYVPVLVSFGYKDSRLQSEIVRLGIQHVIAKPVESHCLRARLRGLVSDSPGHISRRFKVLLALNMQVEEFEELHEAARQAITSVLRERYSPERTSEMGQILWPCLWELDGELSFAIEEYNSLFEIVETD